MARDNGSSLRDHLLQLLASKDAHTDFEGAIKNLPAPLRGKRPEGAAHSPWEVLEHLRITQSDILEFVRNPKHVSPEFPAGYWPAHPAPPTDNAWNQTAEQFRRDLKAMSEIINDPETDLFAPIPHGSGQTFLREALLLGDHNAYHLGELVVLRRLLGAWE
jgi:hypothetical protein